jgi:hypothetical protein
VYTRVSVFCSFSLFLSLVVNPILPFFLLLLSCTCLWHTRTVGVDGERKRVSKKRRLQLEPTTVDSRVESKLFLKRQRLVASADRDDESSDEDVSDEAYAQVHAVVIEVHCLTCHCFCVVLFHVDYASYVNSMVK